jgi:hypothetical protein
LSIATATLHYQATTNPATLNHYKNSEHIAHVKKQKKGDKKIVKREYRDQVVPDLKSFANDPYVLKKAEAAKAFLRKNGVPPGFPPFKE